MPWIVLFHSKFESEFAALPPAVQDDLLAQLSVLRVFGPKTGRPAVDTRKGSRHANMKELRFRSSGRVWRFAFAFDPKRQAIVLCGGDKGGVGESRFYKRLIALADQRFTAHLAEEN